MDSIKSSATSIEFLSNVPPRIYACMSDGGRFIAFWQIGENSIRFYDPSDFQEPKFTETFDSFREMRDYYKDREDLADLDEIVVAAGHIFAQRLSILETRNFTLSKMPLGSYWPRIWRGRYSENDPLSTYNPISARSIYRADFVQSIVATSSLFSYLLEIFKHVEPATDNLSVFGHKIRELLILACTEVESAWRSVLEANSASNKRSYNTTDYHRTKSPLRLDQWAVALNDYPNIGEFSPFSEWNKEHPTKSLPWYDSYNATKHDREKNFSRANLKDLVCAMAALHIMQAAQWGPELFDPFHGNVVSPFFLTKWPDYGAADQYIPNVDATEKLLSRLYFDDQRDAE